MNRKAKNNYFIENAARLIAVSAMLLSLGNGPVLSGGFSLTRRPAAGFQAAGAQVPLWTFEVVKTYPHDPAAYTQGLVFHQGVFLESTGLYGQSSLRRVDPESGKPIKLLPVSRDYFAEGLTVFKGRIFQLTWVNHKAFVYEAENFRPTGEFAYEGEGWGLTNDGRSLILSDGTSDLRFIDPVSFKTERTIGVTFNGKSVPQINELEYIKGEIYANVWQTDYILRIDPKTGRVVGLIDLTGLLPDRIADPLNDVLNGIAYDEKNDRIFLTGKRWPKLFEVRFKEKKR